MDIFKEIAEAADDRHTAMKAFHRLNKHHNTLENILDDLEDGSLGAWMAELGYKDLDLKVLVAKTKELLSNFEDTLPGVHMTAKGEHED